MKWLRALPLLGLLWTGGALAQSVGSPTLISCGNLVTFSGLAANTIMITAPAGKLVNFCGWHVTNTAAAGTFSISTGTGAACGTSTLNITPTLNVTNTAPSSDHQQAAFVSSLLPAQNLCVNPSVTTISGVLYYSVN